MGTSSTATALKAQKLFYNFDVEESTASSYESLIGVLRAQFQEWDQYSNGIGILPVQKPLPENWFNLILTTSKTPVTFRIRYDNLYVTACKVGRFEEQLDFGEADDLELLGLKINYNQLENSACLSRGRTGLGQAQLLTAVNDVAKFLMPEVTKRRGNELRSGAKGLIVIVAMFPEAIRSAFISETLINVFASGLEPSIDSTILDKFVILENSWKSLSRDLQAHDHNPGDPFRFGRRQVPPPKLLKVGIKTKADVVHHMGILLSTPDPLSSSPQALPPSPGPHNPHGSRGPPGPTKSHDPPGRPGPASASRSTHPPPSSSGRHGRRRAATDPDAFASSSAASLQQPIAERPTQPVGDAANLVIAPSPSTQRCMGRTLAEIVSLTIDLFPALEIRNLRGIITIEDAYVDQEMRIYIPQGPSRLRVAKLEGPNQAISADDDFVVMEDLWEEEGCSGSPADPFRPALISWDSGDPQYNQALISEKTCKYGLIKAKYAVLKNAAEAVIEVIFVKHRKWQKQGGGSEAQLYGEISADNGVHRVELFERKCEEFVVVSSHQSIPLDRGVIAVPENGDLNISITIWENNLTGSAPRKMNVTQAIASGSVKFFPKILQSSTQSIVGRFSCMHINISWH